MEIGSRQGKTPIFVKDVPGFFVNRCLSPFMVEVSALVLEGVNLETMDKAMKSYGMPVGPITLAGDQCASSDCAGMLCNHILMFAIKKNV